MFKKIFMLIILSCGFVSLRGQEIARETVTQKSAKQVKGTFQIEYLDREGPAISMTAEFINKIEEARLEDEISYFMVNEKCRIKVFSKRDLENGKNIGVEEFVVVKSFN